MLAYRSVMAYRGNHDSAFNAYVNAKRGLSICRWTSEEATGRIWSTTAEKLFETIAPKQKITAEYVRSVISSTFGDIVRRSEADGIPSKVLSLQLADKLSNEEQEFVKKFAKDQEALKPRVETLEAILERFAEECDAVICAYSLNDPKPNIPQGNLALSGLLIEIVGRRQRSAANSIIYASLVAAISTAVVLFSFKIGKSYLRNDNPTGSQLLSDAIGIGYASGAFTIPLFVVPTILFMFGMYMSRPNRLFRGDNATEIDGKKIISIALISFLISIVVTNFYTIGNQVAAYAMTEGSDSAQKREIISDFFGRTSLIKIIQCSAGIIFAFFVWRSVRAIWAKERGRALLRVATNATGATVVAIVIAVSAPIFIESRLPPSESGEGYLNPMPDPSRKYKVFWYDLVVQDALAITGFVLVFFGALGWKEGRNQYAYSVNTGSIEPSQRVW